MALPTFLKDAARDLRLHRPISQLMRASFLLFCLATSLTAQVSIERWSGDLNVPDPVACTVDPQGRIYVTSTTRRKAADLDIRQHPMWIEDDVALTSVEEKREFLKRELAPGKLRLPRGDLKDHNGDGLIDWHDLTVHSERIYQLRDTDGDGTADKITVFAEGFNTEVTGIAAGILYHDGWVYATIAPDLWRLKDTDDDGVADVREVVAHGFGMHIAYAGHDMHGPRLGLDGRIYWSIGDKGANVMSKEGKRWFRPHEGCVMRVEPDGTGFEIFAHGLRNVQEVAFDAWGNMFGVDNDADLPGEKERLVYITEGSDSGWRCGHQYMKTQSRWFAEDWWKPQENWDPNEPHSAALFLTPPLALASNGPAGFAWEPGTALGTSLRGNFLVNGFPSGVMEAFEIEANGASFEMQNFRQVNSGIMGIGMSWGPDGALYMADWVGGYPLDEKGAVWRVDDPAGAISTERKETLALLSAGFEQRDSTELVALLGHADQRVRLGAQLVLVKQDAWSALEAAATDARAALLARVHAVWGLGIGLRRGQVEPTTLAPLLTSNEAELRAQTAKVLGDAPASKAIGKEITGLLKDAAPRVRFHAAIALGKLGVAEATETLLALADTHASEPFLRHAVVSGLAGCASPEALAEEASDASPSVRLVAALALARQLSPEITAFLDDPNDDILREAVRAIHDDEAIPAAWPALAKLLMTDREWPTPVMHRVINTVLRLGNADGTKQLADLALSDSASKETREEALHALLAFAKPPRLDRVDGMARDYEPRDAAVIAAALQPRVDALLKLDDGKLKAPAIELMIQLGLQVGAEALTAMIGNKELDADVRVETLRLMAAQHASEKAFDEALAKARERAQPEALRVEALELGFEHRQESALKTIQQVMAKGSIVEKQTALGELGQIATPEADAMISMWMDGLVNGKMEAPLQLEVLQAAEARAEAAPDLAKKVVAYVADTAGDLPRELLEGGNVDEGREIVTNNLGANCIACHITEAKEGSQVGPTLRDIGKQKDRRYLLESLLSPSAKIAPGFGMVSVTTKAGASIAGTLDAEDATKLAIRQPDGTISEVAKADIAAQTPPISIMPPMLGILTKPQIRDVVAYLATLRSGKSKKEKSEH